MFGATVLFRYDVRLAPVAGLDRDKQARFPGMDETVPSGGILSPVPGDDLVIKVQNINSA
jgi:hypothetical protein